MAETCRSCDAPVLFVPSAKSGRPMILDAEPRKGVVIVARDDGGWLMAGRVADPIGPELAAVTDVYTDHHATCIYADQWKGKRR